MDASTIAAVVAAVIALVALYFSAASAGAAKRSAEEAGRVASVEEDRRAEERERRHEELRPQQSRPLNFKLELGDVFGREVLWGSFHVPRDYRAQAIIQDVNGTETQRDLELVHAHRLQEFIVEPWPPSTGADCPSTTAIRFKFWPPRPEDAVDKWTCPCRRPTDVAKDGPGHWEVLVNIPALPVTAKRPGDRNYGAPREE